MGGSGGGSAGEVSWPTAVQERYNFLLGNYAAPVTAGIANIVDVFTSLAGAQGDDPYGVISAYNPASLQEHISNGVQAFGNKVEAYSPQIEWDTVFNGAISRYQSVIGEDPENIRADLVAIDQIPDVWTAIGDLLTAADDIGLGWSAPTFDADVDIKTDLADESEVAASTDAQRAIVSDQLTSDILPRFEAGMRDINAVQSSAFVIGRAVIEGMGQRDVTKFDSDLRYKAFLQRDNLLGQAHLQEDKLNAINTDSYNRATSQAYMQEEKLAVDSVLEENRIKSQALLQNDKINADAAKAESLINAEMARHKSTVVYQDTDSYFTHVGASLELFKAFTAFVVDSTRIVYVMGKEETDTNNEYIVQNARWDLDMVQIAGNIVASISGGTSYTPGPTPSQNALGGAFAGAAIGARTTGNAYGAAGGAILGGIGAYLLR